MAYSDTNIKEENRTSQEYLVRKTRNIHHSLRYLFFRKNSIKKICADAVVVSIVSAFIFEVLPHNATFFDLASAHTTFEQKAIHSLLALLCVLLLRVLLLVYKQPWNNTKTIHFLNIMIADAVAGVVYYGITEYGFGSVYPFLLTFSYFALIDIGTMFIRLLFKAISEDYGMTEQ